MSVQFGQWNFSGESPVPEYIEKVSACIAPYGPDSNESYSGNGIRILYRAFHTTKEARREKQPHICRSGEVITWDGRLDNRDELIEELKPYVTLADCDVRFVAAAFERWGLDCFAKLIGDWALSIWDPRYRSLLLAKDPIGPRHLYYSLEDNHVAWSTVLDPLVLPGGKSFKVCEEYIAGWLSFYPATHLTPYAGINSVPPASCVFLGPRKHIVAKYWDFNPNKKIRYCTDREYEEHFRSVFFKAVGRRLRSDAPVLAELSGGRDSSAIVCVADEIMKRGEFEAPRFDTVSYYDDSEPNWNERPYFTRIEEKRGRVGCHIDIEPSDGGGSGIKVNSVPEFDLVPNPNDAKARAQVGACVVNLASRVMLSGTGGDEVMGGIPRPEPELQDLVSRVCLLTLSRQIKRWALPERKPWFHLLRNAVAGFLPPVLIGVPRDLPSSYWFSDKFAKRHWGALTGYRTRVRLLGSLPSFQDNLSTLAALRRQLASRALPLHPTFEKRYPFLDRTLLEFQYAIPREQSVRPHQRRSLMRRALAGIVPQEILNRVGKSYVTRATVMSALSHGAQLRGGEELLLASLGIVDSERFFRALQTTNRGVQPHSRALRRALYLEIWLRNLLVRRVIEVPGSSETTAPLFHTCAPGHPC